ncbi:MAG TPA: serine hydrolase [Actinomycetota bacterium]|nr:serine hydrolase [Actinomycetota bacterium]
MDRVEGALGRVFERWARDQHAPAVSWGVVRTDGPVLSGGVTTDDATPPDADTVFRIASMTKSFTGAALMRLVADGVLRLDDPVADHVPALAGWRGPTSDGPPLTVRHLVSMESGLPTDDAWADRHLDISGSEMDALMTEGAAFAWTPGVAFEYSNLGWGLVGRVMDAAAGARPQDLVDRSVLAPLTMSATTWTRPSPPARVAEPFRWEDGANVAEPEPVGDGQIAPMGGLWSTVRDLATWVRFFLDAWPPREDPDDGPLPRWARREMQQLRRFDEIASVRPRPGGPSRDVAIGYGIGLGVRYDPRLGYVVGHSGGLPGYGSHMRWIPDRGVGVIGLANVTYGGMGLACAEALDLLADLDALGPPRSFAAPRFDAAATRVAALLSDWTDPAAEDLVADNVAEDEPFARRAAEAADVVARHGPIEVREVTRDTPLRGKFTTAGGQVAVDLELDHTGRVQWLAVTDRAVPSDDAIVLDADHLAAVVGTAYVVLRPTGDLAAAFGRWQGAVLDRLAVADASVPAPHVTMKAIGSADDPVTSAHVPVIAELVEAWAGATPGLTLRATGFDVFDEGEDRVPVATIDTAELLPAMRDLWSRAAEAGLPVAAADAIGLDAWIAHLSLAYPGGVPAATWAVVEAWMGTVTDRPSSVAGHVELVVFDGGPGRRVGRWALGG